VVGITYVIYYAVHCLFARYHVIIPSLIKRADPKRKYGNEKRRRSGIEKEEEGNSRRTPVRRRLWLKSSEVTFYNLSFCFLPRENCSRLRNDSRRHDQYRIPQDEFLEPGEESVFGNKRSPFGVIKSRTFCGNINERVWRGKKCIPKHFVNSAKRQENDVKILIEFDRYSSFGLGGF